MNLENPTASERLHINLKAIWLGIQRKKWTVVRRNIAGAIRAFCLILC
jgi:hypothetical protein